MILSACKIHGQMPAFIGNMTSLVDLDLSRNFFTGEVPKDLGKWSPMIAIDLSENQLSGELPTDTCIGGKLLYFCALDNIFGTPVGTCGSFAIGDCHDPNTISLVEQACLNKTSCSVELTGGEGDFDKDSCPGIIKSLAVEAECS
ncbi:hypothetical protein POM88_004661 [Heracleum sosnowskyi]|uniref:SUEL-type lectin domain-containing protein n=1 Tax=Heracleum sosnowskyi TaxID=360622 RepID=A0AAD8JLX5_9APIA|nr:hypothetical protein POM88_004661 [Heracleum sosnowskyi]